MTESQATSSITVSGVDVLVVRKKIKNLHLRVCPPLGDVRVSAPVYVSDEHVRLMVVSKLGWIKKKQQQFIAQPRQSERRYVSGECHYFLGQRYRLELVEQSRAGGIELLQSGRLKMYVKAGSSVASRERLLNAWYRAELKKMIPELLDKWQPVIGREVSEWGIKKMKTRWGSCNITQRRIWLNLELAKKPHACIEYVLVHELVHLHERYHNDRFKALVDHYMPGWRTTRSILNQSPLAHEAWGS